MIPFYLLICGISSVTTPGFKSQVLGLNTPVFNGKYVNHHVFTRNSYTARITKYSSNGGRWGDHYLDRAFNTIFNQFWEAGKVNTDKFHSYLEVEFDKPVNVDRLGFATRRDHLKYGGFPLTATFYIAETNTSDYVKIASVDTPLSSDPILYTFNQTYNFQKFKFEFTEVYGGRPRLASCAFIYFYMPESPFVTQTRNLFKDYNMLTLIDEFNTTEAINDLKSKVEKLLFYEDLLEFYIERALKVARGELKYDPRREFSTNPNTKGLYLKQVGSIRQYCGNKLLMTWLGTDRIPTGITAVPGGQFHFFVQSEDKDPIPRIRFTQHVGHWSRWRTGDYYIYKGHTSFVAPNLFDPNWENAIPGGPVYITNPFTKYQQSSNVTVYIEGGDLFPIFRSGDNVTNFVEELRQYHSKQVANPETVQNLFELVTDNVFITVRSSRAFYYFVQNSHKFTPQKSADGLKAYVRTLYEYEGVKYDTNHPYYQPINEYINLNIRVMQPYAAAYAITEHVGIRIGVWEDVVLKGDQFGWGNAHEIGHMMDINGRTLAETTNNMVANYRRVIYEGMTSRPDHIKFRNLMTPFDASNTNTWKWMDQIGKILTWWNIETLYPNFWGDMNNYYRYNQSDGIQNVNEKMVYYSSLVTGINLSSYYERVGFTMNGPKFTYKGSSPLFKKNMQNQLQHGRIKEDPGIKFWYFDAKSYGMLRRNKNKMNIYNEKMSPIESFRLVSIDDGKYRVIFPNYNNQNFFLGIEVLEGNNSKGFHPVGFTDSSVFNDPNKYSDDYIPTYKFVVYDRTLNHTKMSNAYTFSKNVAKLNGVMYKTLRQAINKAKDGETIYLLDDIYETQLKLPANLKIEIDNSVRRNITFHKDAFGSLFIGHPGKSVKFIGRKDAGFVFEGSNTRTNSAFIIAEGDLTLEYCYFQNLISSRYEGGAIYIGGSKYNLIVNNCGFRNNYAVQTGSCIFAKNVASSKVIIENTFFINNRVEVVQNNNYMGGALRIDSPEQGLINNCYFEGNKAFSGAVLSVSGSVRIIDSKFVNNKATRRGGVAQISGSVIFDGCTFQGNTADYGGALTVNSQKLVKVYSCTFNGNKAFAGGDLEIYSNCMFSDSNFINHKVPDGGGVGQIYGPASFYGCTFENNIADHGGVFTINSRNDVTFSGCYFAKNSANTGGALEIFSNVKVSTTRFVNNKANDKGGAALISNPTDFEDCNFENNVANIGGAIYSRNIGGVKLIRCNCYRNNANQKGSLIYSDIRADQIYKQKIILQDSNAFYNKSPQGSFIYINSGLLDIHSTDRTKIEGQLYLNNVYETKAFYHGSFGYNRIEIYSDKMKDGNLVKFDGRVPDEYPSHFYLSESLRNKYILMRSSDRGSLALRPPVFVIKYEVNDKLYNIPNVKLDQYYKLTIPQGIPRDITILGFYYNGRQYNVNDLVRISNRGVIVAKYRRGNNVRAQPIVGVNSGLNQTDANSFSTSNSKEFANKTGLLIGIVTGCIGVIGIICATIFIFRRKKRLEKTKNQSRRQSIMMVI